MAMYEVPDPDHKELCPYDNTHLIRLRKFPYHLMKCRKNYTGHDFAVCPFNANHEIPRPELRYHTANCADRVALHQDLVNASKNSGNLSRPKSDWSLPPSEEDWDQETPQIPKYSFNAQNPQNTKTKKSLAGMTVAEKRAFHQRAQINYQRKMQGLPPLEDDEIVGPVRAPTVPPPTETPTVFQVSLQQQQQVAPQAAVTATDNKVFAHSLKMAGIGRGRGAAPAAVDTQALNVGRGAVGRGAVGRGVMMGGLQPTQPRGQMTAMEVLQAYGRGRGIPAMQAQPLPVVNGAMTTASNGRHGASVQNGHNSQEDEETFENSEDEVKKEIRRLRKKLKMIERLEDRRDAGDTLTQEEQDKVDSKQMLQYQLQSLTLD